MRIVHIAPTPFALEGVLGGGERYPLELARALRRHVDVELLTFARHPRALRDETGLVVRLLPAPVRLAGHPAHPIAPTLPAAIHGFDIVHTHHMRSTPSRIAALAAGVSGGLTAVTDHGLTGSDWLGLLPRLFDRFLLVSHYSARLLHAPEDRTFVIYGGADIERYRPDPADRRHGVLFVGRITPHKGVDRLIQALPRDAPLTIAGTWGYDPHPPENEYRDLLRRLAADRDVTFAGPVSEDELRALYRQAAVLVLPSVERTCYGRTVDVSELLGLVVLEAMASGTPVVCSGLGGLTEVVDHGVTGYVVEPGNIPELRFRLEHILGNPGQAADMGRRGRELITERFTWQRCAERCLAVYEDMMNSRGSG